MQDRHGIYQVKFNTRAVELYTLYRAAEELEKLFETVEAYKPEMADIKRNYNATYLQELSTVCAEIISAEGHRTAKYVRKDPELSIACSPAAREQILPSWRLPSDVTMVYNSMPDADAEGSVTSDDPNVVDLATGDIHKWWLHRGIELDEKLMPNTHDLYPNPQEVMARRTSEDININTGRSFADDARILQLIIDGQLPDAFPKGETFNALDFLDDND